MPAEVEAGWWLILGLLNGERLDAEWKAASQAFAREFTPENQHRLVVLGRARAHRSAEIAEDLDV